MIVTLLHSYRVTTYKYIPRHCNQLSCPSISYQWNYIPCSLLCLDSFDQLYVHKIHLSIACNWSPLISILYSISRITAVNLFIWLLTGLGLFLVGAVTSNTAANVPAHVLRSNVSELRAAEGQWFSKCGLGTLGLPEVFQGCPYVETISTVTLRYCLPSTLILSQVYSGEPQTTRQEVMSRSGG